MLNTCPKCNLTTTMKVCRECNVNTNPPSFPMENKNKKDIKILGMGSEKVPNIPRYSEKKQRFDLHNYSYKFIITKPHNYTSNESVKMGNWTQYRTKYKGHNIQVNTKSLVIYIDKRYKTSNPEITEQEIEAKIIDIANNFATENNLFINSKPIPISKEVKVIDCRVNENFRTANFKSVYPTPSPIEFTSPTRAVKDTVKFVTHIDKIEDMLTRYTEQLDLHLQVEQKQLEVATKTLETLDVIKRKNMPILYKLKRLLKWKTKK